MKIYNWLFIIAFISLILVSCNKQDNFDMGESGKAVTSFFTGIESAFFMEDDKENTFVKFSFDVDGTNAKEAKLQISINGEMQRVDYGTYTEFPATAEISLVDIASLLNTPLDSILGGDVINIEVLINTDGEFYRSNTVMNPMVACAYDPANISGQYAVASTSWESSGSVTITPDEEDPFKFYVVGLAAMDGFEEDGDPLPFIVNPLDYSVTAPKTVLASSVWSYTNYAYESSSPGSINTCNGTYKMGFTITVDQGSFGSYNDFVFTKK